METYRRSIQQGLTLIVMGGILMYLSLSSNNFVLLYDGLAGVLGIYGIVLGSWKLLTPYATLSNDLMTIKSSILTTHSVRLKEIQKLVITEQSIILTVDNKELLVILNHLDKQDREGFVRSVQKWVPGTTVSA